MNGRRVRLFRIGFVLVAAQLLFACGEDLESAGMREPDFTNPVLANQRGAGLWYSQLDAGDEHNCGRAFDGGVTCWGDLRYEPGPLSDWSLGLRYTGVFGNVAVSAFVGEAEDIASGGSHSCASTATNVQCWGNNDRGQLGDGSTLGRTSAQSVPGLAPVVDLAAGRSHTCGITQAGGGVCWGDNSQGQLGTAGTPGQSASTPVPVDGLENAFALDAGAFHSCALTRDPQTTAGGVDCWGIVFAEYTWSVDEAFGIRIVRSFRPGPADSARPDRPNGALKSSVAGLGASPSMVAVGELHACAVSDAGIQCWGNNEFGQLGDGTSAERSAPVSVVGPLGGFASDEIAQIAAGTAHTCVRTAYGEVYCWGLNNAGQLARDPAETRTQPVPALVDGLGGTADALTVGRFHTCAQIGTNLRCWGEGSNGQLGELSATRSINPGQPDRVEPSSWARPVDVAEQAQGLSHISAGDLHTCAVTSAGTPLCWGGNGFGELGDDGNNARGTPSGVSGLTSGVTAIAAGGGLDVGGHTCAVTADGTLYCWGKNGAGQLGDGTRNSTTTPVVATAVSGKVTAVATGFDQTCAATSDGDIFCFGDNISAQQLAGVDGVTAVSAGFVHQCFLKAAGTVHCFGNGGNGQLGNGAPDPQQTPVQVSGLADVIALSSGDLHNCALTDRGAVWCWGENEDGQLGNNSTARQFTPIPVPGLGEGVRAIAAGGYHTCAITHAGALQCWGLNNNGQLGDNSTTQRLAPVTVAGMETDVVAVATGSRHTCAVTVSGAMKCFGANSRGQLGDSTTVDQRVPVTVPLRVNTAPVVTYAADPVHPAGTSGAQIVQGFATIDPGADIESGQIVSFDTVVADPDGILESGSVWLSSDGALRYGLSGETGAAVVTVTPRDNGGIANGGADRGESHEFRVFVGRGADLRLTSASYCAGVDEADYGELCDFFPRALENPNVQADYRFTVANEGPTALVGARFAASELAARSAKAGTIDRLTWTCTTPAGSCTPASGSGRVDTSFDLAVGEAAMIRFTGELEPGSQAVAIVAQASLPNGVRSFLAQDDRVVFNRSFGVPLIFSDDFE